MIRVIVIVFIVLVSIVMSITLNRLYKLRILSLKDFKYIITIFISELSFNKCTFMDCFNFHKSNLSKYFVSIIDAYYYNGCKNQVFKKDDFIEIYNFIDTVTLGDVDYTIATSKYYLSLVDLKLSNLEKEYSTCGVLYIKLIVILGIAFAILIL